MNYNNDAIKYKPKFWKVIKRGFSEAWSYMALVVFGTSSTVIITTSLMFVIGMLLKKFVPQASYALVGLALLPAYYVYWVCSLGVNYFVHGVINYEHPELMDVLYGIKKLIKPASLLFGVSFFVVTVLISDVVYFAKLAQGGNVIFMAFAMLFIYAIIYWISISLYFLPVLIYQDKAEASVSPFTVIKKSYLLAADNPLFSFGLLIALIPLLIGYIIFCLGTSAFLTNAAARELYIKYDIVEEPNVEDNDRWRLPEN
jgi:hypothetical protein